MPTPLHAHFEIPDDADSPYPMVPDDDDDAATAMASVNSEMVVDMNMPGIVTPLFVDGAAPIGLIPGENTPFTYVDWQAMQSMVVTTGVTFAVQAVEIGANQVPLPIGDAVLVTCGPFECAEDSATPPELSIANSKMCTEWDPSVEIQVGKVDNDVIDPDSGEEDTDGVNTNDGIDLGIVTSSGLKMNVKSIFSGVSGGQNTTSTSEAASGSNKTLGMKAVTGVITVDTGDADVTTGDGINESMVCDNTYTEEDMSSMADRPAGCFRLIGPGAMGRHTSTSGGPDYLAGWSIELSPLGADVMWGDVDWEDNPFEDLECEAMEPIMVSDHVDVCDMFDTEVSMATGKGWKPEVVFNASNQVVMWRAGATAATGHEKMFKTLWFDDNLNGKIKKDDTSATNQRPDDAGARVSTGVPGLHDLYDQNAQANNITMIWEWLTDSDGDLIDAVGDLGKVDLLSDTDNPRTADNETTIELEVCDGTWTATTAAEISTGCGGSAAAAASPAQVKTNPDGKADNYVDASPSVAFSDFRGCSEDDGGDDADGSECDAMWENDITITFADGTFGCSTTRDITVTCTWDADGGMAQGRNALPTAAVNFDNEPDDGTNNLGHFLKCSAK